MLSYQNWKLIGVTLFLIVVWRCEKGGIRHLASQYESKIVPSSKKTGCDPNVCAHSAQATLAAASTRTLAIVWNYGSAMVKAEM